MFAVLSDILGNLEALDAVLADIDRHRVSTVYCLGDLVGYGPNPIECIERAMKWDVVLLGHLDQAVMFNPDGFNASLVRGILWTRSVLESRQRNDLWNFLAERPRSHRKGDYLFVHGSARNPVNEYVFPEDTYNQRKMERIFALVERYCFCGHTHIPGVLVPPVEQTGNCQFFTSEEINNFWRFDERKTIVNVGSVGQPRDGDWRTSYVIVDGCEVTFHRVEYDVNTTRAKINNNPDLDNFLGGGGAAGPVSPA
jgi:diadenosine tetraphosphatase ApaH/serine/threonine PP2A family protein phosphatase